jgi:histidyl-tRNA synthetase
MPAEPVDVYAIVPGPEALPVAMVTCEALRAAGLAVQMHAAGAEGQGSMKAQFKKADASGARFALVFGADEVARGAVGLKDLKNAGTAQITPPRSPIEDLVRHIRPATPQPS